MKTIIALIISLFFLSVSFSQNIWQQSNGPYTGSLVHQLTINSSGELFAVSYSAGIFRSTNNGSTWLEINQGLPQVNFEGDRVICIASNGDIYVSADNLGIYKSTNNGNTWFQTGLTQSIFNSIICGNNGYIFAGTPTGGGIYRTTNGGINWTHLTNGLPVFLTISDLSKAPDGTIYAGANSIDSSLYKSTDNGESWHWANLRQFSIQALTVNVNGYIFAAGGYNNNYGLYVSTNGGNNWVFKNSGLSLGRYNSMFSGTGNELFLCSDSGLFRSVNNGDNWTRINNKEMAYAFVKKQTGEYFLSALKSGVFKSTNSGSTWLETNAGLFSTVITSISITQNNILYCGTMYCGAYRSSDNGSNWSKIWDGKNSQYVYPVFQSYNGFIFAGIDSGFYRSTNNGTNWSKVLYLDNISAHYINTIGHIFLGASSMFNGIYRSTDNGSNWAIVFFGYSVNSITANSTGSMFAGTGNGIYRSVNDGSNWAKIGNINEEVYSVAVGTNGYMYAGTRHSGLFRSTDFGNNWNCVWSQFDEILNLILNQNGHIFALTGYSGVFRSTNYGLNWSAYNSGLFNPMVLTMIMNSNGYLFAGTYGAGVYRTINSTIGIKPMSNEIPISFSLSQNYPNPFNPTTKINFALPRSSNVIIKVFDITGKEIETLLSESLNAGKYEIQWNGSEFSSGIYFYRLGAGQYVETRKMVLVK